MLAAGDRDHGRPPGFAGPADTGDMSRTVNWVARGLGFAWIGIFAFFIARPTGRFGLPIPYALPVQVAGYCLAAAGLLGWLLTDLYPAALRRDRWLPMALGAVAFGSGVGCTSGGGGTALVVFVFVATMAAAADLELAPTLAVTAAAIVAIVVSGLAFGSGWGAVLGLPAIALMGLLTGRNRGAYRIQAEQAAMLAAQRERLQAEQHRADLLDERARIAREIHDVLAHSLGALGIQIQAARSVLYKDADRAGELLAAAQQMAAEGLVDTRRAVHALRTDTLPLGEELARVSDTYAQRYNVAVSFDSGGVPAALPPDATVALLRIAQEALVNAAKHAAGQPVTVRLDYGEADVRLSVRNDLAPGAGQQGGVGTVNGGYGLTGMRERLRLLDGTLEAGRRGDQWVVTAELPRHAAGSGAESMAS
jgi:signal transduction histidine kinase